MLRSFSVILVCFGLAAGLSIPSHSVLVTESGIPTIERKYLAKYESLAQQTEAQYGQYGLDLTGISTIAELRKDPEFRKLPAIVRQHWFALFKHTMRRNGHNSDGSAIAQTQQIANAIGQSVDVIID